MGKKLYYKNEKGRYVEYVEPEPPFDNCLYRKYKNGKKTEYVPCSMRLTNDIGEGVWVVTKHMYGKSITSGKYLYDSFLCLKASDIQDMPLSQLGGMDKLADYLCTNWKELPRNVSTYDLCRAIVSILFKYEEKTK